MTRATVFTKWIRWGGRILVLLAFAVGVIVLILWLAGKFAPKVPAKPTTPLSRSADVQGNVEPVRLVRLPLYESAVGTVRAVHETSIGSRLLARVMEVNLKAGQQVRAGDVLVRLDDTDLKAKLQQAQAAVASIEAVRAQAAVDEKRYAELLQSKAVSRQEYEKMATALRICRSRIASSPSDGQRSPGDARLCDHPVSHRRHHHRQAGRCRRYGDTRPDAGHAVRSRCGCNWWPAFGSL